jgi:hypothetical protein
VGLMDKVKEQATVLARDSKAKLDQVQARRRADDLLCNLGALVYAERTGRASADNQAKVDKLIADLKAHEAETGISLAPESADLSGGGAASDRPADQKFPPESSAGTTTQV